ncbi:MAG: SDR family oxidoreductase [Natronomonas sp.]
MQQRTALITGCSSGIGRATVRAFLEEEWQVYATARNPADIETLGEEPGCQIATLDVTDPDDVDRVVDRIVDEAGRIDALVNNAGVGVVGPIEDVDADALAGQFDVNVAGVHRLVRAVAPHMRDREDGTIVTVSSVAGRLAAPGMGVYAASKHAVEGYSDALRLELEPFDVDVSVVQPGPVKTGFRRKAVSASERLDRTDAYDDVYTFQEDATLLSEDGPLAADPADVAAVIVEAAVSTNPDPRYQVGPFSRLLVASRLLPDRLRDRAFGVLRSLV